MTPLRFGLIGCSSIARRRMAPTLCASPYGRLEHIGSRDPAKAAEFAREFKCAKAGTYEAVLNDPAVDAVYISTPPALHEPWVRAALEHGKHVLCEKPAFPNLQVAIEMVKLARRHGKQLMEGYMFHYHPQHAMVRSLLEAGRIGDLRVVQSEFTFPMPAENSFRRQNELGGGVLSDAAGYPVAAAMMLFQAMPEAVSCRLELDDKTGVDHLASITLEFSGGRLAQLLTGYGLHYRSRYTALGNLGRIEATRAFAVPPDLETNILVESGDNSETLLVSPADQFQLMLQAFVNSTIDSVGNEIQTKRLLRQHAVMDAARRSHLEKRLIPITAI
jgi:NDP-hexose-3-ketoreductase